MATSLLPADAPDDAAARLDAVVERFTDLISRHRAAAAHDAAALPGRRTAEPAALPLRQGRAIGWIAEALDHCAAGCPTTEVHRLALAIRSATGIEALVWLTDVAGLSRDEALALMRWSAQALLQAALGDGPPPAARSGHAAR